MTPKERALDVVWEYSAVRIENRLTELIADAIQSAILAEREECAKAFDDLVKFWEKEESRVGMNSIAGHRASSRVIAFQDAAKVIRARSQPAPQIGESQKAVIPPGMKVEFTSNGLLVSKPEPPPIENKVPEAQVSSPSIVRPRPLE